LFGRGIEGELFVSLRNSHLFFVVVFLVTENEIQQGCVGASNTEQQLLWFNRTITDIENFTSDKASRNFMDKSGQELDENASDMVKELRTQKLPAILPSPNVNTYSLQYLPEHGVNVELCTAHKAYLDQLCQDFEAALKGKIDASVKER